MQFPFANFFVISENIVLFEVGEREGGAGGVFGVAAGAGGCAFGFVFASCNVLSKFGFVWFGFVGCPGGSASAISFGSCFIRSHRLVKHHRDCVFLFNEDSFEKNFKKIHNSFKESIRNNSILVLT